MRRHVEKMRRWWFGGAKDKPTHIENVREFTRMVTMAKELSVIIATDQKTKEDELEYARMIVEKSMMSGVPAKTS